MKVMVLRTGAVLALGVALALLGAAGIGTAHARPADGGSGVMDAVAPVAEPDAAAVGSEGSGAGTFELRPGRHELWIDRVELPGYARGLYDLLVEATDADGEGDLLIDGEALGERLAPAVEGSWREPGRVVATANGTYLTLGSAGTASLDEASEAASVAYAAFDRDHPEVFWLEGSCRVGGFVDGTGELLVGFKLSDPAKGFDLRQEAFRDADVLRAAIVERDAEVDRILAGAPAGGAHEVVRWIHGRLAARNAYNSLVSGGLACDDPLVWESLSALRGSSGASGPTCEGYARAFKVLCDAAGIPCVLARGLARHAPTASAERHMWNLVQVDGSWYAVDVTWDDVDGIAPTQSHLLVGADTAIGLEGTFATSHVATNETFRGMARLSNGPELSSGRFHWPEAAAGRSASRWSWASPGRRRAPRA